MQLLPVIPAYAGMTGFQYQQIINFPAIHNSQENTMNRKFHLYPAVITVLLLCTSMPAHTSGVKEIKVGGSGKKEMFGQTVSISGGYAIAGVPKNDTYGKDSGVALLFRYTGTTWEQAAELRSPDDLSFGHFGYSAAVYDDPFSDSGDYAIVGACGSDGKVPNSGAAYIFKQSSSFWSHHAKLTADDGKRNDDFGFSVSISGDMAIVGAYRSDGAGTDAGAAYIFKNSNGRWTQQAKLQASDARAEDHFGWSVSISGDYAIVGAHGRDDKGIESGAAYVFYNGGSGWIQQSKLLPSDGAAGDFFGFSVSVSGSYAIVGANADDDRGDRSGSAYIFSRNGTNWSQTAKLTAGDGSAGSFFGRSVSLSENYAAVGADGAEAGTGAVYIFRKNGSSWNQKEKIMSGDKSYRLGASVSVSDSPVSSDYFRSIAGAGASADTEGTAEAVYFFGNEPASSPAIHVSPDSLSLSKCYTPGRAAEERTDSAPALSTDEVSEFKMGLIIPDEVKEYWQTHVRPPQSPGLDSLPDNQDWSRYDTPAKAQGGCGACAVFSTVALIENLMNQANLMPNPDLSEQALLSCTDGINCSGGWYWDVMNYIKQFGAVPDTCYGYIGKNGNCGDRCLKPDYTVRTGSCTPASGLWGENHSVDDLRMALQSGPLVVSMRVPADGTFIGGYRGGVYDYKGIENINWSTNGHAVLLVGYNDAEKSFKAKNSWGPTWGESGYFRIAYDDVTDAVKFGSYACSASGAYLSENASVLTVSNRGTADLIISSITTNRTWLAVSPSLNIKILPNAQQTVFVSVQNWASVPLSGENAQLTLDSNDPQKRSLVVGVAVSRPLCPPLNMITGNIDCKEGIDLRDAILALQVLTGIKTEGICDNNYQNSGVDVNGDKRIGMEEVIYILRHLSE